MKKLGIGLLILIVGATVWYFGIRKEDYQITFQVKGSPQSTYHQILKRKSWGDTNQKNITTVSQNLFDEIEQKVVLQDTTLQLIWKLEALNDSITKVFVSAWTIEHSLANKLAILTGETSFTKSLKRELKIFRSAMNSFGRSYRIVIDGIVEAPELSYLYVTNRARRTQKAAKMIGANVEVYPTIGEYRVEKDGSPFVKVKTWNIINDSITFDFGFPIRTSSLTTGKQDSLDLEKKIKFGSLASFKALKATFYGNYSKSDQAWFALLNYAKKNGIKVKNEPLEIFHNNPMEGGDDKQWKAEIFMPILE